MVRYLCSVDSSRERWQEALVLTHIALLLWLSRAGVFPLKDLRLLWSCCSEIKLILLGLGV